MSNGDPEGEKFLFSEDEISKDNSITINSCHSPMREVEVLHDYIIDLLNSDNTVAPGDVLVIVSRYRKILKLHTGYIRTGE